MRMAEKKKYMLLRCVGFTDAEKETIGRAKRKSGKLMWSLYHDAVVAYCKHILEEDGNETG